MTYTPNHQVASLTQSIDSVQQYVWTFSWAPNGLEKAVKSVNGIPVLTQDFTTDPSGRIRSMTYDTVGEVGYDGELYFHYDHYGNTTLLTNPQGSSVASFQYDLHSGKIVNEWNTNNLEVINLNEEQKGGIGIELSETYFVLNDSSYRNIDEYTSITTTPSGKWTPDIGDVWDARNRGDMFNNNIYACSFGSGKHISYGIAYDCKCIDGITLDKKSIFDALDDTTDYRGFKRYTRSEKQKKVDDIEKYMHDCCDSGGAWFEINIGLIDVNDDHYFDYSAGDRSGYFVACRDKDGNIIAHIP